MAVKPTIKIRVMKVADVKKDPVNARVHGPRNIETIKNSLLTYGQVEPLLINTQTGLLVGGHGRVIAMEELGWETCQVSDVDLNPSQAAALGIILNRSAELAEWNLSNLSEQIQLVQKDPEINIAITGFTDEEVKSLVAVMGRERIVAPPPTTFPEVKEDIKTDHCCPKCGYKWSGKSK